MDVVEVLGYWNPLFLCPVLNSVECCPVGFKSEHLIPWAGFTFLHIQMFVGCRECQISSFFGVGCVGLVTLFLSVQCVRFVFLTGSGKARPVRCPFHAVNASRKVLMDWAIVFSPLDASMNDFFPMMSRSCLTFLPACFIENPEQRNNCSMASNDSNLSRTFSNPCMRKYSFQAPRPSLENSLNTWSSFLKLKAN